MPEPEDDAKNRKPLSQETLERLDQEAAASVRKENRRVLLLAAAVVAFLAIAHFTPLRSFIENTQNWKQWVDEFGFAAHGVFCLTVFAAVMCGIPRLPLCAAAGMIFGFAEGLALSWIGSTLGSYGAFLLARWGGRRLAEERVARWPWLKELLAAPSLMRVFWVRQLMVPGMVLNVLFGMTQVRHRTFLAGTLLGYLPLNIAFSLVGGSLGKESWTVALVQVLAGLAVVNLLAWGVLAAIKRHRKGKQPTGERPESISND